MSSLRLALKQSLQESGQQASQQQREKDRRRKEEAARRRRKQRERQQHQGPKKRGPGRPRKDSYQTVDAHRDEERRRIKAGSSESEEHYSHDDGGSSDEQEFSGSSDNDTHQASVGTNEAAVALFHDADDDSNDEDHAERKRRKMKKKEQRAMKHRNSAANTIQNEWKKKKGKNAEAADEERVQSKKMHQEDSHKPSKGPEVEAKPGKTKTSGKTSSSGKAVQKPSPELLSWMGQLSVARQRSNITKGLRVKVRFEMKKKRDGKLIRRAKWYGGLVTGVSTGGSKIRIKYDDGTSEVTKFPDQDIVVDEEGNGEHRVSVETFIPPSYSEPEEMSDNSSVIHDDNDEPHEEPKSKKEKQNSILSSPKSPRSVKSKASISRVASADTTENDERVSATAPLSTVEIPSTKASSPESAEVQRSHSHNDNESSPNTKGDIVSPPTDKEEDDDRANKEHGAEFKSLTRIVTEESKQTNDGACARKPIELVDRSSKKSTLTIRLIPPKAPRKEQPQPDHRISCEGSHEVSESNNKKIVESTVESRSSPSLADRSDKGHMETSAADEATLSGNKRSSDTHVSELEVPSAKRQATKLAGDNEERMVSPLPASRESEKERTSLASSELSDTLRSATPEGIESRSDKHGKPRYRDEISSSSGAAESPSSVPSPLSSGVKGKLDLANATTPKMDGGHRSPKESPSPTPLSATPVPNIVDSQIAKPVSTIGKGIEIDVTKKKKDVLASSEHSAFERKESRDSSDSGKGCVDAAEDQFASPHTLDRGSSSKASITPAPRSGRRAAQQANERISARQEVALQGKLAKAKRKREKLEKKLLESSGKRKRRALDGDDDSEDDNHWVQCDKCLKWRVLPDEVETDKLPKHWYCEMNVYDSIRNSCDAPEQTTEEIRKAKRKKRGRFARSAADTTASAMDAEDGLDQNGASRKETSSKKRDRQPSRSPTGEKKESSGKSARRSSDDSSPKNKRSSPSVTDSSGVPESPRSDVEKKSGNKGESSTKKGRKRQTDEAVSAGNDSSGDLPAPKKRGRKKGRDSGSKESKTGKKGSKSDDAENQEWVQCEKCEKWRRLPPHISAEDLPEVWYCNMNTWDPSTASCEVAEDKADPNTREYNIFGSGQSSYGTSGKLSYRSLIFGTGRKQNRPISERTRAAESLFASVSPENSEGNCHPTVMYAKSSAFVSRKSSAVMDDSDRISFLDLMSHSNLWVELRGGVGKAHSMIDASYNDLGEDTKASLKALVCHSLGTSVFAAHELLLEVQCRQWDKTPQQWEGLRPYCTLDMLRSTLDELEKDRKVEIVGSNDTQHDFIQHMPRYRRIGPLAFEPLAPTSTSHEPRRSRCMKISKPWKRAKSGVNNDWCM